jgi:integrase/recombinase XerC
MKDRIECFLQELASRNFSADTIRAYRADLAGFAAAVGDVEVAKIDVAMVRQWVESMYRRKLGPSTMRRQIACIRSFLRTLQRDGLVPMNAGEWVSKPKLPKRLPEVWSEEETCRFLDAIAGTAPPRDVAILEVLYGTGIRISELVGLNLADVDRADQWLLIRGKGKRERFVPYGRKAAIAIERYLATRAACTENEVGVFVNRYGVRISSRGANGIVKRYGVKWGDPSLHPHTFRHGFATDLLNNGADLRTLQELLGHKNLQTVGVYTHVSMDLLRDVYESAHPKA